MLRVSIPTQSQRLQTTSRSSRSRLGNDPQWEVLKDVICKLYETKELKDVIKAMQDEYQFKASVNMYKKKLKAWGVDKKYIKPDTYKAVLKTKRKRELEDPAKLTEFKIGDQVIPTSKIARWEHRMLKDARITLHETFSEVATPPDLSVRTPTPPRDDNPPALEGSALPGSDFLPLIDDHTIIPSPAGSISPLSALTSPSSSTFSQTDVLGPQLSESLDRVLIMRLSPTQERREESQTNVMIAQHPQTDNEMGTPTNARSRNCPRQSIADSLSSELDKMEAVCGQGAASEYEESIARLTQLVQPEEILMDPNQSKVIITDWKILLGHVQYNRWKVSQPGGDSAGIIRGVVVEVSSLLSKASFLTINCTLPATNRNQSPQTEHALRHRSRSTSFDTQTGHFTITVSEKLRERAYGDIDRRPSRADIWERDFKIRFKPRVSSRVLTLYFSQSKVPHVLSDIPRIAMSNVLPIGSPIFQKAAEETPQHFLALIHDRRLLHDFDVRGWSLLHYAVAQGNVAMTKFLIACGLEVDEVSHPINSDDHYCAHPFTPLLLAYELGHEEIIYILLDAKADPTLEGNDLPSFLLWVVQSPGPANYRILRNILERSVQYNPAAVRWQGLQRKPSLMMLACCPIFLGVHYGITDVVQKLELLLRHGCSIDSADTEGLTCLHLVFLMPKISVCDLRDLVIYLIMQGASLEAEDAYGRSVMDFAYHDFCHANSTTVNMLGSGRGDALDAALHACGEDISQFKEKYSMNRVYTELYTRQDFEQLWAGQEEFCPYWDDAIWCDQTLRDNPRQFICVCSCPHLPCTYYPNLDKSPVHKSGKQEKAKAKT